MAQWPCPNFSHLQGTYLEEIHIWPFWDTQGVEWPTLGPGQTWWDCHKRMYSCTWNQVPVTSYNPLLEKTQPRQVAIRCLSRGQRVLKTADNKFPKIEIFILYISIYIYIYICVCVCVCGCVNVILCACVSVCLSACVYLMSIPLSEELAKNPIILPKHIIGIYQKFYRVY